MISDVGNMKFSFYKVNPLIEISLGSEVKFGNAECDTFQCAVGSFKYEMERQPTYTQNPFKYNHFRPNDSTRTHSDKTFKAII